MTHGLDHFSTAQRPNHDTHPKARPDCTNLSWREPLDPATNAQESPLQRIAHLHESETQKECKEGRYARPLYGLHESTRWKRTNYFMALGLCQPQNQNRRCCSLGWRDRKS